MKITIFNRTKDFSEQIDKFSAKWNQLKPKNDILNDTKELLLKAIEIIKEMRNECDQIIKIREKVR